MALFGAFGVGNMGNDESARAMISLFRRHRPGAILTALSRTTAETTEALGIPALSLSAPAPRGRGMLGRVLSKLRDLRHMHRLLADFDHVVVPGTGLLERTGGRLPGGDVSWLLILSISCRMRRVPLAWFGMGGSRHLPALQRRFAVWAAEGARYRSYRDSWTPASLGGRLAKDAVVMPDIVYGRPDSERSVRPASDDVEPVVAVAVIDYDPPEAGGRERYLEAIAGAIAAMRARGWRVRLVIADTADEAPAQEVARRVEQRRPDDDRLIVEPYEPFEGLLARLRACDVLVASRYHALLAATLERRPIVAVSHADKDDALLNDLGIPQLLLSASAASAEQIVDATARALEDREALSARLDGVLSGYREHVESEFLRSGIGSTEGIRA